MPGPMMHPPVHDHNSPDSTCYVPAHPTHGTFPVVWANHTTAPFFFCLYFVLILYAVRQIIKYIRSGDGS